MNAKTIKILGENIRENLYILEVRKISYMEHKRHNYQRNRCIGLYQNKKLLFERPMKKMKRCKLRVTKQKSDKKNCTQSILQPNSSKATTQF